MPAKRTQGRCNEAITIPALLVGIALCIAIKMRLYRKQENIDSMNGVHGDDKTKGVETVIGHFVNDTQGASNRISSNMALEINWTN